MAEVCRADDGGVTICRLTRSTGLSLAESFVHIAGKASTKDIVGPATTFFSYSWEGTKLEDMLAAIDTAIRELEEERSLERRYVWIDMFCASQNLLAGVYRDLDLYPRGSAGYLQRKEDTDRVQVHYTT